MYPRPPQGIKQCCGIERAQVQKVVTQENHSLYALLAFLRLEVEKL
jgi:putative transposase